MMITKVKICGITNYDDAVAAMDMGADLLGFNFYPQSPRYIEPANAAAIIKQLPAFIDVSGVFVNSTLEEIREIAGLCQLDWVQLHGDENTEFCQWLAYDSVKTMKALRVKDAADLEQVDSYFTDAILLDAFDSQALRRDGPDLRLEHHRPHRQADLPGRRDQPGERRDRGRAGRLRDRRVQRRGVPARQERP